MPEAGCPQQTWPPRERQPRSGDRAAAWDARARRHPARGHVTREAGQSAALARAEQPRRRAWGGVRRARAPGGSRPRARTCRPLALAVLALPVRSRGGGGRERGSPSEAPRGGLGRGGEGGRLWAAARLPPPRPRPGRPARRRSAPGDPNLPECAWRGPAVRAPPRKAPQTCGASRAALLGLVHLRACPSCCELAPGWGVLSPFEMYCVDARRRSGAAWTLAGAP